MGRAGDQRGFTLIELLVVLLILAILTAIAIPVFVGQRAKAQDGAAKADARSTVSQMEACYTELDHYDGCPGPESGIPLGTARGRVEVTSSGDTFMVIAHSHSGNTYTVSRLSDGTVERTCDETTNPAGSCQGGSW